MRLTSKSALAETNRACEMKSYLKNVRLVKTTFVVCTDCFDLLALLGGPALLSAFIWKFPALLAEFSVVNSEFN